MKLKTSIILSKNINEMYMHRQAGSLSLSHQGSPTLSYWAPAWCNILCSTLGLPEYFWHVSAPQMTLCPPGNIEVAMAECDTEGDILGAVGCPAQLGFECYPFPFPAASLTSLSSRVRSTVILWFIIRNMHYCSIASGPTLLKPLKFPKQWEPERYLL